MKMVKKVLSYLLVVAMVLSSSGFSNGMKSVSAETSSTSNQTVTIYYKGYSTPYIHYKIGNGNWTAGNGVAMTSSSEQTGYTHKITIDMGSETVLTACFNDGNGNWDSDNGYNYTFGIGVYGYYNKNIVQLEDANALKVTNFTADMQTPISITDTVYLSANASGGVAPYTYRFGSIFNGREINLYTYNSDGYVDYNYSNFNPRYLLGAYAGDAQAVGTHTLFVDVKDATGKVVRKTIDNYVVEGLKITSFTANVFAPQNVGTAITFKAEVENEGAYRYNSYSIKITKNGVTQTIMYPMAKYQATWTPTEAGLYTITYSLTDYLGQTDTASMTYLITDVGVNTTTVYYNNNNFSNAFIHYQIGNGSWTNVPGVQMEQTTEREGYQYKAIIVLGNNTYTNVCFNNGNGSWDSRNGLNYSLGTGVYGIKNGATVTLQ